jgi:putative tricarboxylic transport membrane protein
MSQSTCAEDRTTMNRRDLLASLFWLGTSIFVCVESIKSDVGSLHAPGPGFLPFWSAFVLGALSLVLMVKSHRGKTWKGQLSDMWKGLEWRRVLLVIVSLFLYPLILPFMGYIITTFAFIVFLLCLVKRSKMWIEVASSLAIALVSYFIFFVLLDVRLPKGIFGF